MRDRLPAPGKANRVRITQDDGKVIEGMLSYADDAVQEGSCYNRANVLPDSVCEHLNLNTMNAEPKDALLKAGSVCDFDSIHQFRAPSLPLTKYKTILCVKSSQTIQSTGAYTGANVDVKNGYYFYLNRTDNEDGRTVILYMRGEHNYQVEIPKISDNLNNFWIVGVCPDANRLFVTIYDAVTKKGSVCVVRYLATELKVEYTTEQISMIDGFRPKTSDFCVRNALFFFRPYVCFATTSNGKAVCFYYDYSYRKMTIKYFKGLSININHINAICGLYDDNLYLVTHGDKTSAGWAIYLMQGSTTKTLVTVSKHGTGLDICRAAIFKNSGTVSIIVGEVYYRFQDSTQLHTSNVETLLGTIYDKSNVLNAVTTKAIVNPNTSTVAFDLNLYFPYRTSYLNYSYLGSDSIGDNNSESFQYGKLFFYETSKNTNNGFVIGGKIDTIDGHYSQISIFMVAEENVIHELCLGIPSPYLIVKRRSY